MRYYFTEVSINFAMLFWIRSCPWSHGIGQHSGRGRREQNSILIIELNVEYRDLIMSRQEYNWKQQQQDRYYNVDLLVFLYFFIFSIFPCLLHWWLPLAPRQQIIKEKIPITKREARMTAWRDPNFPEMSPEHSVSANVAETEHRENGNIFKMYLGGKGPAELFP